MAGYRPAGVPPADLTLLVDDRPLAEIKFPSGGDPRSAFQDYTYETSSDGRAATAPLKLEFVVNAWRPADYGFGDVNQIGVAVESISVSEVTGT